MKLIILILLDKSLAESYRSSTWTRSLFNTLWRTSFLITSHFVRRDWDSSIVNYHQIWNLLTVEHKVILYINEGYMSLFLGLTNYIQWYWLCILKLLIIIVYLKAPLVLQSVQTPVVKKREWWEYFKSLGFQQRGYRWYHFYSQTHA